VRRAALIPVALTLVLAFTLRACGESSISADLAPGVRASFKHKIIVEEETWPSTIAESREGRALLELEARGGFRLHVRVREHPGDYLICIIYVDGEGQLSLDRDAAFVLDYGDREVESIEVLFTDSPLEMRVFSTGEETIVLTRNSDEYSKARSGGYLAAVRFPRDSLPEGGRWVPDSFELRGGYCDEGARG